MHVVPSLLEDQRRFLAALYNDAEPGPIEAIAGAGLEPDARLRIYRHSSALIHTQTLRTTYPALLALVGEVFFEQVAVRYRGAYPSRRGNLQAFGAHFADFLESLPETRALPYLGDVARLEWLRQQTALAAEASAQTATDFKNRLAKAEGQVRLVLHPSLQLFASPHAVLSIWRYAMHPAPEHLALPERGDNVVLWRDGVEVAMAALDDASFTCIHALTHAATLEVAIAEARALDPAFDPEACVASLAEHGLITGCHERSESTPCPSAV